MEGFRSAMRLLLWWQGHYPSEAAPGHPRILPHPSDSSSSPLAAAPPSQLQLAFLCSMKRVQSGPELGPFIQHLPTGHKTISSLAHTDQSKSRHTKPPLALSPVTTPFDYVEMMGPGNCPFDLRLKYHPLSSAWKSMLDNQGLRMGQVGTLMGSYPT